VKSKFSVITLCTLLTSVALSIGIARADKRDVDIKAPDGANLKGTIYAAENPGPGVILLHQCNSDRKSWEGLASRLAGKGLHVLTLDYRGYGESHGATAPRSEKRAMRQKWAGDVEAAYKYFISQDGVDGSILGAGGASCGVNQSAILAGKHPEIQALVLLSGGVRNSSDQSHIAESAQLAVFGAASKEDTGSAMAIEKIVGSSKHSSSKLVMYNNAGHGVPMFAKEKELEPMIVDWLTSRLKSAD
jgi:dienelactone hydrolase